MGSTGWAGARASAVPFILVPLACGGGCGRCRFYKMAPTSNIKPPSNHRIQLLISPIPSFVRGLTSRVRLLITILNIFILSSHPPLITITTTAMRTSVWLISVLATMAAAAPSFSTPAGQSPAESELVSKYFRLLAARIPDAAAACDLSLAVMPVAPNATALAPPSAGLSLKHVAIGRGTQNYTCDTANPSTAPVAAGAVASLFNASCIAASYPDVLALMTNVTLQWNLNSPDQATLYPSNIALSGHHYFTTLVTPFFNLDTTAQQLGQIPCAKQAATPAPADASKGQGNVGNGAVPWLKLIARDGATGGLQEVYRLNTAGGAAPGSYSASHYSLPGLMLTFSQQLVSAWQQHSRFNTQPSTGSFPNKWLDTRKALFSC
jgi:hypothetical protein